MLNFRTKHPGPLFVSYTFMNDNFDVITDIKIVIYGSIIKYVLITVKLITKISTKSVKGVKELDMDCTASIINLYYQTDGIERHLGDIFLGMSLKVLAEILT